MIKLKNILNEAPKPKVIDVLYIEKNGKLYSIKVDGKKVDGKFMDDNFSVKIPDRYDSKALDRLIKLFKQLFGIKFTYDNNMDVS